MPRKWSACAISTLLLAIPPWSEVQSGQGHNGWCDYWVHLVRLITFYRCLLKRAFHTPDCLMIGSTSRTGHVFMYVRMCVCFHHSWGPTASAAPCLCAVHQVQLACDQALIRAVYDRGHTSSPFLQPLDSYSNPCLVWICSSRTQCTGSLCLSSVNTETSARAHGCCIWNHINTPGLFMSWLLMILKVLIIVVSHSGTYITTHLWLTDRKFLKSSKKIW